MAPRWRRSLPPPPPPCPKINLKRRANSRFHLNANPKIETEWFLDAGTVILGLEIRPRNLLERTNLSLSLFLVLVRGITFPVLFLLKMSMFSKKSLLERYLLRIDEEGNFSISNRANFPATRHFGTISKPFSRDRNFSLLASLAGSRDRPTELSTQMVSNYSLGILLCVDITTLVERR